MNVVIYPAESLRRKATPVEEIDDAICKNAEEMLEIMYDADGIGLAAAQVGWLKRLIVIDVRDEQEEEEKVFINPYIVNEEGTTLSEEGCLSFPGVTGKIPRSEIVEVVAYNLKGEKLQIKASGLLARVFQHEIDHLNGMLFIDKMTPASSMANSQKIKEFERIYRKVRAS
ncbi:MAG: peptide deformylase [Candidatus Anammoxibacter sp.]